MRIIIERERTSAEVILYALYLYFLGLSFRSTSKAIQPFGKEGRSHVAIWKWVQRFNPERLYHRKRVSAFLIDETMLQIGTEEAWLWVAVELIQYTNKFLDLHLKTQEYDSC
jgi:putative transposase